MVVAELGNTLYVATMRPIELVRQVLEAQAPSLVFVFVPCFPDHLSSYLNKVNAPAYANEVRELHHGLSLLEGSDATTVELSLLEAPMKLHLSANTCKFGQEALLQAKLFGHQDKVPVPPGISCDLKR